MGANSIARKPRERRAAARRGLKKSPILQGFFAASVYGNKRYKPVTKMAHPGMEFREKLQAVRVVPGGVIKGLGHAVPLAEALVEGGPDIREVPGPARWHRTPSGHCRPGPGGGNPGRFRPAATRPGRPGPAGGRPAPPVIAAVFASSGAGSRPKEAVPMPDFRWGKP